ncbi:type II secretion system protein [Anatilimnocola floriformis]|uniref:type II secretion system protein n=1 Tax=Anatilimnocola floriformis TaxID=2948575 RepID=UPI0020C4A57F|nr:type II secretion system protein [Anatilimnocola floriformis]
MKTHPASTRNGLTLLEMMVVLVILLALSTLIIPVISWIGQRSQLVATRETCNRLREVLVNQYMPDMGELPRPRAALTTGMSATRQRGPQLVYLFVNPDTHEDGDTTNDFLTPTNMLSGRRWQGPYPLHSGSEYFVTDTDTSLTTGTNFTNRYGVGDATTCIGDPTIIDAWGNPIVIQEPDFNSNNITDEIDRQHTRLVSAGRNGIIDTPPDVLMPTVAQRVDDVVVFLFRHDEFGDAHLNMQP